MSLLMNMHAGDVRWRRARLLGAYPGLAIATTVLLVLATLPAGAQTAGEATPGNGPLTEASKTGVSQQPGAETPEKATPAAEPPAPVTAGWRDGFFVQSEEGDYRLQIGLLIQADGRFAAGDGSDAVTDTFLIRRVRPYLRGRFAKHFEFNFNPDFAGGVVTVQDAFIDTVFAQAFRIRAGKAKTPFGLERLHSATNLLFYDRALPSSLAPNRDVGVQVMGDLRGGLVSYSAGIMNGVPDGGSADVDTTDSKDLAGRLVVRPFTWNTSSPFRGFGAAIAATRGRQSGAAALPAFRTPSMQQPYFAYSGASADGIRTRYSPQFFYFHRVFGAFGEFVRTEVPIQRGGATREIVHRAWQIAGSVVLTGEAATDSSAGVRPRANFDVGRGHWGALQVAARYHVLEIDDAAAFTLNFAAPGASREAEGWTLGLSWFLTPNFKYVFNVERTVFDGSAEAARRPETALLFRTQISF